MHVYLVRHGETDLNVRRMHQSPGTPLNTKGFDQARTVSEYLRPCNADFLISSTYDRTLQTARTIGNVIDLVPQRMHIFREVERPASLSGTSYFHIRTLWYVSQLVMHRNNARWRYDDAENFTDIYTRVRTAFAFLESLTEEHKSIIIVSHSEFINLMIMYMCHDRVLTLTDIVKTSLKINELKNCDVTHVEYVGPTLGNTCAWQLVTT